MIQMSLAEIASITAGSVHGDQTAVVTGPVVIDSRRAAPGGLFAALTGENADGHDYAEDAVAAGVTAVLCSRPVGVQHVLVGDVTEALAALSRFTARRLTGAGMTVVGITGSSGKTSTKDLTGALLERLGPTVAPEGSFNNELGLPLTVLRADESTRYLVLEMSARGAGHIAWLCDVAPPFIGAVLNVGHAHVGEFGSLEGVAKAKGELVEALPADGVAILNAGDPRVLAMATRTAARVVTFGSDDAQIRARDVSLDELARPSFTLVAQDGTARVRMLLHGAHHVANALAAAAIAHELGMPVADIATGLSETGARSKWRMELRRRADGVVVINDAYNANPDSVRAALDAVAHLAGGRGIAVLGYMAELGDEAEASHAEVGRLAALAGLARIIAVGEGTEAIVAGARSVAGWDGEAEWVASKPDAVGALQNRLRPSDVVLVKASSVVALWEVANALLEEVTR